MPPHLPRKRLRSDSPEKPPPPKRHDRHPHTRRSKESVFSTLDTSPIVSRTLSQTKKFLERIDSDSTSSEEESDEDDFEDVPIAVANTEARIANGDGSENEVWEDALGTKHQTRLDDERAPIITGDIDLTLSAPPQVALASKSLNKQGPSKVLRHIRNATHCMHVQLLMYHNLTRNAWIQDKGTQKILVEHLPAGVWKEVDRYWRDTGISEGHKRVVRGGWTKKTANQITIATKWKDTGKHGVQVFDEPKNMGGTLNLGKVVRSSDRTQRDWGAQSGHVEPQTPNLSAGDPLLRLLKYLSAYWKTKFRITSPSLRKRGYLMPSILEAEIKAWEEDCSDPECFGERIENLEAFRDRARKYFGSRDTGQQLFTALLRALGIEARMVASLQPVGFGWSQAEEGNPKDLGKLKTKNNTVGKYVPISKGDARGRPSISHGTKHTPIDLSDSEGLTSAISISSDSDTTKKPTKKSPKVKEYDDALPYPTYWTEAISDLTHTPIAVSCLPRTIIATSAMPEQLVHFYCRGAAAEKARQVFAYVIAFSSDGTAKDVTTRYLPKNKWPGRTKGSRMLVEKIPIHNKRGKVKHWEERDWFKSVLRSYARPLEKRRPWDEIEDEGDLVPAEPSRPKDMDEEGGKETLQGYKDSAEYILERHLRREEAIKPDAKVVRHFTSGKGDNEKREPVYLRKDVVVCKSVESWHKEGREVQPGEQPLKYVPTRAVTVIRKREIEEREREEGEKVKQGLYSTEQTDWIIPEPIVDGKIPRNAFGNIDVYVPTMVPRGAVHVRLKGTAKLCRKLRIDYAEACTGFEFGKQRAVPVLTGVVVASENKNLIIDAWKVAEAEKATKEQEKRENLIHGLWRKFFVGLRAIQRMNREFGEAVELPATEPKKHNVKKSEWETFQEHTDFEGGFLRDESRPAGGFVPNDTSTSPVSEELGGGFFTASQEEHTVYNDSLDIDHGEQNHQDPRTFVAENAYNTPISLHSALQQPSRAIEDALQIEPKQDEEAEEEVNSHTDTPRRKPQRPRPRPTQDHGPAQCNKRKPSTIHSHESSLSELSESDDDSMEDSTKTTPANQATTRKSPVFPPAASTHTTRPKRKAARNSDAQVKSHFFANDSKEETDLTDKSPVKKGSGATFAGSGSGRGRGRGRTRARGQRGARRGRSKDP